MILQLCQCAYSCVCKVHWILKDAISPSVLVGRTVFGNFLKSEFSKENLDFWVACEVYKKSAPSKMANRSKQIYQQHVEANATNEVIFFIKECKI